MKKVIQNLFFFWGGGGVGRGVTLPPVGFPSITHNTGILGKTQTRVFPISGFLVNPL